MSFLVWLLGGERRLGDFEMAVVEQVAAILPPDQAARLRARAGAINKVQWEPGAASVNLYQMERGRPVFPRETALLDYDRVVRFAEVESRSDEPASRLRATLFLGRGNLSSIDFSANAEHADVEDVIEWRARLLGPPFVDPDSEEEASGGWPLA